MELGIIQSKLQRPKVKSSVIHRREIYHKLSQSINHKLTLVMAPAGFGKSTVVSGWLTEDKPKAVDVAWVSLEEDDGEEIGFWNYFICSIDKQRPGSMEQSLHSLGAIKEGSLWRKQVIGTLVNELVAMPQPMLIVLDDLYRIKEEVIYQGLRLFLQHMPGHVHLMVITRQLPELGIGKLRANEDLVEVTREDLLFKEEDLAAFYKEVMGMELSPKTIGILQRRTEGWAVGLQMAGLYLKKCPNEEGLLASFTGDYRYVMDYLVEEVFEGLEETYKTFLLGTCMVEFLSGGLCNALVGISNGQEILEELENRNLFIIALDEHQMAYRYHHLFGEFLRRKLDGVDLNRCLDGRKIAADWYKTQGQYGEAISLYLGIGDYEKAAQLIEEIGRQSIFAGEIKKLHDWCQMIPNDVLQEYPRMYLNFAWFHALAENRGETDGYLELLGCHIGKIKDEMLQKECRAELLLIKAVIGSLDKEGDFITQYLQEVQALGQGSGIIDTCVQLLHGTACIYNRAMEDAFMYFKRSYEQSKEARTYYILALANRSLVIFHIFRGQYEAAYKQCQEALRYLKLEGVEDIPVAGIIYIDLAEIYLAWNELEEAKKAAKKAIRLGESGHIKWFVRVANIVVAQIMWIEGKCQEAKAQMELLLEVSEEDLIMESHMQLEEARLRIDQQEGNQEAIKKIIEEEGLRTLPRSELVRSRRNVIALRYLVFEADEEETIRNLKVALREKGAIRILIEICLFMGIYYENKGRMDAAFEEIEEAVHLAAPERIYFLFIDEKQHVVPMIKKLRETSNRWSMQEYDLMDRVIGSVVELEKSRTNRFQEVLSERELEVYEWLKTGKSNSEIAACLYVSVNTVKTHLMNIYSKLGVHNRIEALAKIQEITQENHPFG